MIYLLNLSKVENQNWLILFSLFVLEVTVNYDDCNSKITYFWGERKSNVKQF